MHTRPDGADDHTDRAGPVRPDLGSRRVVWGAFGVSALFHLLVVALYPLMFDRLGLDAPPMFPTDSEVVPDGLQVIQLIEIDETQDPERPEDPAEIERVEAPAAEAEAPALEGVPGIEIVPLGPSAAERLRPHLADARLWATPSDDFFELTLEQREEVILAARIGAWLDSVQAGQAATDALTDWTFTDSKGGRWGISPGKIHLGDITIPLPVQFGIPVGKRDETRQLVWQWEEIMRQAARADVELSWRESAAAIRERRDAERAEIRPDTIGGR